MRANKHDRVFRRTVEDLLAICPVKYPVSVRRCKMANDDFGDADFRKGKYHIRINRDLDPDFQIWVLVHEYAHCLSWNVIHDRTSEHGPYFGVAYAEAYNAAFPKADQ